MHKDIITKKKKIAIIGLGYVGLPIALEFAKRFSVIGFDIKQDRVDLMKKKIDPSNELISSDFDNCDILFTSSIEDLKPASFYIIAVPTPIDDHKMPDLTPLLKASHSVGKVIGKGDYIVYESTVYPGCTEEDCVPILEQESKLKFGDDFKVGFSPERINPGDKLHTLTSIKKIVSGSDNEALENIAKIYGEIIKAGIHKAPTIKVAEAAKIIENTQRDVNIALMNELSMIFGKMGINTFDVLEAAGTKWNFLKFFPGLVGGHCIGVDPYYLSYKAKEFGYHAQMINSGRAINDSMGSYVASQTVKKIIANNYNVKGAKVLIMGATFKEDVSDIRNSKVADIVNELNTYGVDVSVTDPYADSKQVFHEYAYKLVDKLENDYNAIIVAVNHKQYLDFDEDYFKTLTSENGILVDIKGIYKGKISDLTYWSL
ncbi:MAG: nucleotide sugar dehydrogenase [Bacteroidetes bacterium]|nr:nucleotide sugar dehydrogenase [Bacteroidota bacterium]